MRKLDICQRCPSLLSYKKTDDRGNAHWRVSMPVYRCAHSDTIHFMPERMYIEQRLPPGCDMELEQTVIGLQENDDEDKEPILEITDHTCTSQTPTEHQ